MNVVAQLHMQIVKLVQRNSIYDRTRASMLAGQMGVIDFNTKIEWNEDKVSIVTRPINKHEPAYITYL